MVSTEHDMDEDTARRRREFISSLFQLAYFLNEHPDVPAPRYGISMGASLGVMSEPAEMAEIDAVAAAAGVSAEWDSSAYRARIQFGPLMYEVYRMDSRSYREGLRQAELGRDALEAEQRAEAEAAHVGGNRDELINEVITGIAGVMVGADVDEGQADESRCQRCAGTGTLFSGTGESVPCSSCSGTGWIEL